MLLLRVKFRKHICYRNMLIRVNVAEVCDPHNSVGAGARDDDSSNTARQKIKHLNSMIIAEKITPIVLPTPYFRFRSYLI